MSDEIQYDPPVTVEAGQIQFVEACHPPLVAGGYNVSLTQVVKESEGTAIPWNSDPYASESQIAVDAPRFTLNPADLHSVYPPIDQTGRFDNALPHVVFTRRTLPWERTLDSRAPKLGQPFPPWMGLLLVQEDELLIRDQTGQTTNRKYEVRSLPVASRDQNSLLFHIPENGSKDRVLVPDLGQTGLDKWQSEQGRYEKDFCLAIDLPAELFKAIAPRVDDLPYLAHVRQVDTGDKEVSAINDKGWFSLVIGNRLPQADKDHRVFLVSLEGLQERLQPTWTPQPGQMIRLAVLGTWAFRCEGTNDFKEHMKRVHADSFHLPLESFNDKSDAPQDIVNGAYARGYSAFNHVMRQAERTVSWYRGPLVPLNYDKPKQIQEPASCADGLLRYDPNTGLFDVSYAAAWQLGRLLALQNQSFASALNRARKTLRTEAEQQMRQAEINALKDKLGLPQGNFIEEGLMDQLSNGAGEKLLKAVPK
jgi:hypothetical protein